MLWSRLSHAFRSLIPNFQPSGTSSAAANQKTSQIIHDLTTGHFGELRTQFILPLRWMLTESLLQKGWSGIRLAFGPLVKVGTPTVKSGVFYTSATVPLDFKRANLAISLKMTRSGKLFGLHFRPLARGSAWIAPTYADPRLFTEEQMRLGSWFFKVGGTLSLPNVTGPHPCVVLLAGSGPCDRDSSVGATKPFKDLAWGLATRGVGVLRFDKVTYTWGWWYRSNSAITLTDEYMNQVNDAIQKLHKHPMVGRIFVLGHSLGACVAPRVVATHTSIAGMAIMAGPAREMYRSAIDQMVYLRALQENEDSQASGGKEKDSEQSHEDERAHEEALKSLIRAADLADSATLPPSVPAASLPFGIGARYWLDARTFDPVRTTEELEKPILVLQGGRDYQVTVEKDYSVWRRRLEGRRDVEFRLYESLNHLFIPGEGAPNPGEYEKEGGHVEEEVVRDVADWVVRQGEGRGEERGGKKVMF